MSRIFALISVGIMLLIGSAAFGASYEASSSTSDVQTSIVELLGSGLEISALIPLVLVVALFLGVLGVVAQ